MGVAVSWCPPKQGEKKTEQTSDFSKGENEK